MSYKFAAKGQIDSGENRLPYVVLLTILAERPIQQIFEFKERELAEKFVSTSNDYAQHIAIRLYDPNAPVQK